MNEFRRLSKQTGNDYPGSPFVHGFLAPFRAIANLLASPRTQPAPPPTLPEHSAIDYSARRVAAFMRLAVTRLTHRD